ncbi:hypothetical protein Pyn_18607 [Prunus yedoensis var. nudiflora]|uniref:Uncharacterized protein n=1 Tax=Prunus yedoensis var. nudiflora TaxID=2094558 RepID=A0A315AXE9_PRUYE|nr:hypothetical protein Pyn_18607 [Prunus yedoensis var. nudiflora]
MPLLHCLMTIYEEEVELGRDYHDKSEQEMEVVDDHHDMKSKQGQHPHANDDHDCPPNDFISYN